jgi:hypothetical protein
VLLIDTKAVMILFDVARFGAYLLQGGPEGIQDVGRTNRRNVIIDLRS